MEFTRHSLILEKAEVLKSWANSDGNEERYRNSWSCYRNVNQENKENIDWKQIGGEIPVITDNCECNGEINKTYESSSADQTIDIVESLNSCTINCSENTNGEGKQAASLTVVKRATIVKPPQNYTSLRMSPTETKPFSFIEREKENQQWREARRNYYNILNQKSARQPFKARPAPKFKPVEIQTTKKFESKIPKSTRMSTGILRMPKALDKPNAETAQLNRTFTHKYTSSFPPKQESTNHQVHQMSMQPSLTNPSSSKPSRILMPIVATPKTTIPSLQPTKSAQATSRRPPTIPRPPKLCTEIRARERRQFDEMMKQKQMEREHLRKMELATIQSYERNMIAQMRRSTIHKPATIPHTNYAQSPLLKRPSIYPLVPTFIKRPRWI